MPRLRIWPAMAIPFFLLFACERAAPPEEPRLRPVRFVMVSDDSGARDRSFSGIAKSTRESRLSFKVPGTVIEVPAQIGQRLDAGDLIARLDAATYSLQVQQAQASLVEAQANERNAAANYERTKGLYANNNASRNDLDVARAQAESVTAQVRSAAKALEIARLNESYTQLRAPLGLSEDLFWGTNLCQSTLQIPRMPGIRSTICSSRTPSMQRFPDTTGTHQCSLLSQT